MKNIIKRISAFAMAFTLLGAGSAVTQSVAPQLDNSITAYAGANSEQQAFIDKIGKAAQMAYAKNKVLPSLTIAQAIIESRWGKSVLARDYYNYFGMKAGSSYKGETVTLDTKEEIGGNIITVKGKFRVYHSFDEGMEGYYKFITGMSRYSNIIGETNYKEACRKIQQDGWATDSKYATTLINTIETYDLTKYDFTFEDVSASDWFYNAVQYVYKNNIMSGTSARTFEPNATLTRAQFVTVLYNMEGEPAYNNNRTFYDVSQGQWYTAPILWAADKGIASGYGNGNFGVNDKVTREQLITMLYNYETTYKKHSCYAPADALKNCSDASKVSSWALDPMRWAFYNKIISGKSNGKLDPQGTATRAECAQIIYNFKGKKTAPVLNKYTIQDKNGASVRKSAGTSGTKTGALAKGSVVTYDETANANGYTWYHIASVEAKSGSWGSYSTGWVANV